MNAIYMFGCSCGSRGRAVRGVQSRGICTLYNTKRDASRLVEHVEFLKQAGLYNDSYPAVVVSNGGESITLLEQWKQSA